ncbi:hypothetical protein BA895_00465 [Humibacillus sp. DSM 29435]|uniref:FUSC family protein n=1 Tax=Humibacillus sp. DSM 29435 TaxID=1869167 RepID=UPI0008732701|nr:FUSC family protein [Humibacillus sp. DSM 29435]OFE18710.1 hypothetical protein BA895_00465 [Humibacillus sp. DSM 29435]
MSAPSSRNRVAASLVRLGPHGAAHRVALRAGTSVLVPLLVLVLVGRVEWAAFAVFGAFVSLYGRHHTRAQRAGMQAVAGFFLVGAVTLGTVVALVPDSRWLVVGLGALLAAAGSLTSDAYGWHPPGPIFILFGFAVCGVLPATPLDVPLAFGVAAASALFSIFVGNLGALRDPGAWERPVPPNPQFADAWNAPGARAHLLRYVVALLVAGGVATALDWQHPYWAMVAAIAVLSGPDRSSRLTRSVHRVIGTFIGIGVAALLLSLDVNGVVAVLVIAALQVLAELFVARNYAVALLFITPLALLVGQLVRPAPAGPLVRDRLLETVLGAAIAVAVLLVVPDRLRQAEGEPV